jgi:hypothetical protein
MRTAYRIGLPVLAAAAAAAATLALAAAPAAAATHASAAPAALPSPNPAGAGVDAARTGVTNRINLRLASLTALRTAVNGAQRLTAAHKASLTAIIDHAQQGLTALNAKVAGETTLAALKADAQSMVDDYRTYVLIEPQVHLVIAVDLESTAAGTLHQVVDKESAAIDAAKAAGKDVAKAEVSLADLRAQLTAADAAITGKADVLLAIKPGPDATAIRGQISPVREGVRAARTDLRKAAQDARQIRQEL